MRKHYELASIFLEDANWETIGDDTQFRIIESEDEYIIAFRGSNSQADWKNNFNFPKTPYKNMHTKFYVHRGFLKVWKLVNDYFLDLVKDVDKPITIVGHSYGGAVATLCMEDLYFNYPNKRSTLRLVAFGSPRLIGFFNFKKIKERWENSTCYTNPFDLVSKVPFIFMGFRHVKKLEKLNPKKGIIQWLRFIDNHMIWRYEEGCKKEENKNSEVL